MGVYRKVRIRFIPYSRTPGTVCMREEIYGCLWEGKDQVY